MGRSNRVHHVGEEPAPVPYPVLPKLEVEVLFEVPCAMEVHLLEEFRWMAKNIFVKPHCCL